jgi:hypothetical protein
MLPGMYLWTLVGHDTAEGTLGTGIGSALPTIVGTLDTMLLSQCAFVARVIEVVPRLSVAGLQEIYVPTGREWSGRRDNRGGVHWTHTIRTVDPDQAYSLPAAQEQSADPQDTPAPPRSARR